MRVILLALVAAAAVACGPAGTVQQLELRDVTTGYYDEGVVNGENKLVPSVTFKLHNNGAEPVGGVQFNVIFQRVSDDGAWDEVLIKPVGSDGLASQQTTSNITVRATIGYTGQQARAEMLQNSQFVDVRVKILGKTGSGQWSQVAEIPIERNLITQ